VYKVKCLRVGEEFNLHCQLLDYIDVLKKFLNEVNEEGKIIPCRANVQVGSFYFVQAADDKKWKRVQLVKVEESQAIVHFIDEATQDAVSVNQVFMRSKDFISKSPPQTTIEVKLRDLNHSNIRKNALNEWLSNNVIDQTLNLADVSCKETTIEANVFFEDVKSSINNQISEQFSISGEVTLIDETISTLESTTQSELCPEIKDFTQTSINDSEISGIEPLSSTLNNTISTPKNSAPFPKAQLDAFEKVLCTYVGSSQAVSFQLLKYETVLNVITELLVDAPAEAINEDVIRVGMACIARSVEDGNWYRGEIISIGLQGYGVLFIDFGNCEVVPAANLREVFDVRFMQPATCVTCNLAKTLSLDEEKTKEWLEDNCIDQMFHASFTDPASASPSATITFVDKIGIASVNDILQTQFSSGAELTLDEKPPHKIEYIKGIEVETTIDQHDLKWMVPRTGSYEKVVCASLLGHNMLNFQLVRLQKKLDKLMSDIANGLDDLKGPRFLEKDSPCIAQFTDLQWYRARIRQPHDGYATVEFVDFGNVDEVIVEDIRGIRSEYLNEPVFCLKCRLHDVEIPLENQESAEEYLNKTVVEDAPEVFIRIVQYHPDTQIADVVLIQEGHDINEFFRMSYGSVDSILRDCDVRLFDKVKITIPSTQNLSSFWCMLHESSDERERMMKEMNEKCPSLEPVVDVEVDQKCCALSQDGNWYRATVEEIVESKAKVLMVDVGFSEKVELTALRPITPKFLMLPVQGFMASFFNLRPLNDGWSDEAVEFFNTICKDEVLTATILNYTDQIRSVALSKSNEDQVYELLSNRKFAVAKSPQI